ncbi:MAG: hypothetical protein HYZ74_07530 [Elusimicrobia bacterium]|nr:hypothetical protein [Elusimicrobiota bacterium]
MAEAYWATGAKAKAIAILKKITAVTMPDDPADYQNDLKKAAELLKKYEKK